MQDNIVNILQQHDIVLFDEICVLCNGWAKFLIQHDRHARFKLASVQSALGQEILKYYALPNEHFDTMYVIKNAQLYSESTAFLKVIQELSFPFSCLKIGYLIPKFIRDFLYRRIALNRYRLFGTTDQCLLPSHENKKHFLDSVVYE
ncbi:MAG: thiol-disulfide oxidoreductase DCC family protein [Acinetobacter sp.]